MGLFYSKGEQRNELTCFTRENQLLDFGPAYFDNGLLVIRERRIENTMKCEGDKWKAANQRLSLSMLSAKLVLSFDTHLIVWNFTIFGSDQDVQLCKQNGSSGRSFGETVIPQWSSLFQL